MTGVHIITSLVMLNSIQHLDHTKTLKQVQGDSSVCNHLICHAELNSASKPYTKTLKQVQGDRSLYNNLFSIQHLKNNVKITYYSLFIGSLFWFCLNWEGDIPVIFLNCELKCATLEYCIFSTISLSNNSS